MSRHCDVVIPTVGRASLHALLDSLAASRGPLPDRVLLVDDRQGDGTALDDHVPDALAGRLKVLHGRGAGPAAARNTGWRASSAEWVAFLDDDVVVAPDWLERLDADLADAAFDVAGVQGKIAVPLVPHRRPTDWERNVAGLETARWATADLAYRRLALETVGGFDERFPRAYREDADLGLRLTERGWRIGQGRRTVRHPVRPADRWVSVRLQAGNADDALMRVLHGPRWRQRAGVPAGRRPRHLGVTAAALGTLLAHAAGRKRVRAAAAAAWALGTAELTWARIRPGPRTTGELATMLATSAALPIAATSHWIGGWWRVGRRGWRAGPVAPPHAVLFDRDGTLVEDVPYNGDPARVRLRAGAREAVARVRAAGVPVAMVSNQSGVGRGLITLADVDAVNRRVAELLGVPLPCFVCPHRPEDGCGCRKPAAGLLMQAASALDVDPVRCAVVGDIGADMAAARAAGCRAVLVPTPVTRPEEVRSAPDVAMSLPAAVDLLLDQRRAASDPVGDAP